MPRIPRPHFPLLTLSQCGALAIKGVSTVGAAGGGSVNGTVWGDSMDGIILMSQKKRSPENVSHLPEVQGQLLGLHSLLNPFPSQVPLGIGKSTSDQPLGWKQPPAE